MFKLKGLFIVFLLFPAWIANAGKNLVKAGLTGSFFGDFNLAYEGMLNSNRSLQIKVGYLNPVVNPFFDPKPSGFDYSVVTPHTNDVFTDIIYLKNRLKHKVNEDNHTSKLPFIFSGIRMGLSIGIAF